MLKMAAQVPAIQTNHSEHYLGRVIIEFCFLVGSRKQPYAWALVFPMQSQEPCLRISLSDQSESFRSYRELALKSHDIMGAHIIV